MSSRRDTVPLSKVCQFRRGLTYSKADESEHSNTVVLRATNIDAATQSLELADLRYIHDAVNVPDDKKVKQNAILICTASGSKSHLGKVAFIDRDYGYAFGGFMGLVVPDQTVEPKHLYYMMISPQYEAYIAGLSDGTNINNLRFNELGQFALPRPAIAEQRRIVGILDEAFAAIATARANTEKNLQNARELFQARLDQFLEALISRQQSTPLGEVCERVSVGHVGPTSQFYCDAKSGIPFLRSQNVRSGYLSLDGLQYVTPEFHASLKKSKLRAGDILFVRVGANRGDCCEVPSGHTELNCANIVFARPTGVSSTFVTRYCQSTIGRSLLLGMTTGAAQGVINTSSVAQLPVPVPSSDEQHQFVELMSEHETAISKLRSVYSQKLGQLESLKHSLLHHAFTGEL